MSNIKFTAIETAFHLLLSCYEAGVPARGAARLVSHQCEDAARVEIEMEIYNCYTQGRDGCNKAVASYMQRVLVHFHTI